MQTKKKYMSKIETYFGIVEKPLDKRNRNKIVYLIIIDEHNRKIISKLIDLKFLLNTTSSGSNSY